MFDNLTEKISAVFDRLRGKGVLTEDNIAEALREIRIALLEADVALATVKVLTERIRARAIGTEVIRSVTPGQMVIKIVHDELIDFLGSEPSSLNLQANSPFSFLMVGLQGSGKTTTAAKIANFLKEQKRVLLVSLDIYRPAAQLQLEQLAQSIGVPSLPIIADQAPVEIVQRALAEARRKSIDLIVFDTAGRTNIDKAMMEELKELHAAISPLETLLVADGMLGQDAVQIAKSFQEAVPLTGLVFTRMDGSARGGAVLSMKHVTACPVKLLGTGERVDRIIPFDPQRVLTRFWTEAISLPSWSAPPRRWISPQQRELKNALRREGLTSPTCKLSLKTCRKWGGSLACYRCSPERSASSAQSMQSKPALWMMATKPSADRWPLYVL